MEDTDTAASAPLGMGDSEIAVPNVEAYAVDDFDDDNVPMQTTNYPTNSTKGGESSKMVEMMKDKFGLVRAKSEMFADKLIEHSQKYGGIAMEKANKWGVSAKESSIKFGEEAVKLPKYAQAFYNKYSSKGRQDDDIDLPDLQAWANEKSVKIKGDLVKLQDQSQKLYDEGVKLLGGATGTGFYPIDFRIERCIQTFHLNPLQLEQFWLLFQRYDAEKKGVLYMEYYFAIILDYPRSSLTDAMFALIDSKDENTFNFGEFVELTCTFACFEQVDLLKYFFYILDKQKTGSIEKNELKHFIMVIWENKVSSNVKAAMDFLDTIDLGEGTFIFQDILQVNINYPNLFFPVFKLQINIIQTTLGEGSWDRHKDTLTAIKRKKRAKEMADMKAKMKEEADAMNLFDDELVLKRMGFLKFYFLPWLREAERNKLRRIAAIEDEMTGT